MDCRSDLLLVLVWDETASGTARSNIAELSYLVSVLFLAVPEAVLSHTKVRSISSAGLSLRRELCAGWVNTQHYKNFFGSNICQEM